MSRRQNAQSQGFAGSIKKFLLSAFVIITFVAYYFHERNAKSGQSQCQQYHHDHRSGSRCTRSQRQCSSRCHFCTRAGGGL